MTGLFYLFIYNLKRRYGFHLKLKIGFACTLKTCTSRIFVLKRKTNVLDFVKISHLKKGNKERTVDFICIYSMPVLRSRSRKALVELKLYIISVILDSKSYLFTLFFSSKIYLIFSLQ
jgi:hypothetical protein